ncbi:hypothetical protein DKP79_28520, partial [Klebsiella pneumoniae]
QGWIFKICPILFLKNCSMELPRFGDPLPVQRLHEIFKNLILILFFSRKQKISLLWWQRKLKV